ncbi:hypothetical protein HG535_0B03000 [Zygotorulaspora mrakii]|uniref:Ubiquitin carboxyl-terminal hydrolase n=1 Tax=Zygotorulaspora mrakii TaxID=42260 RepID=A0A7H9AY80_ZYGMR|nr:uncharacterized protein HG535_0B03000 [Zygotorulaspora mrakii]QLG71261.1 hypothetical protein HG535_0B03000 [Zygotorulaspora mrakii]
MSAINSHDNGEESYSMYPKTSSPPLPSQGSMHFPAYQPPVPLYAYPQVPYMYAGQTPAYPFNMMNQNQMMYQGGAGGSMPQQNGSVGAKKKWSNDGNSGGSNTNMTSSKVPHYHHHQSSPSYHPASVSSHSNVNSPINSTATLTSRADQYKFFVPKTGPSEISMQLPLFFNTKEEDYSKARSKRHALRLRILQNSSEKEENYKFASKQKEDPKNIAEVTTAKDNIGSEISSHSKTGTSASLSTATSQATLPEIPPVASPPPAASTPNSVKVTSKSWSAVASNAVSRTKQVAVVSSLTESTCSSPTQSQLLSQQQSRVPQRKEGDYIPPSTKGAEPLGSIALRMCYDPDFIDYTLKSPAFEKNISIKSVVPRGIVNRANVCFMSSVLQVLLYCRPFVDILNVVGTRNPNTRVGIAQCKLLDACINIYKKFGKDSFENEKKISQKAKSLQQHQQAQDQQQDQSHQTSVIATAADAINPDEFYGSLSTIPKFKDLKWGHQEDAEEFLTHLLDQLHEEFISSIDSLTDNEIQNLLKSINDDQLRIFFIRNLPSYKKAEFNKNTSTQLKELLAKYDTITESDKENGWHEVSGSSRRGKKTKSAAKRTVEMEASPMSCLFGGQFRSVLDIPNNKESQSITLDPFQTIQLDISDKSINDLETAFKKFSEFEFLPFKSSSGDDVEAKKQTFIDKLPQVLLIQLKRFQFINNTDKNNSMVNYNAYNGRIEKICKKINYDHELIIPTESISSFTSQGEQDRRYTLTGVIYHHGLSSDGGHYTADVYNKEVDKWYRIDDVNIIELNKTDVLKGGEEGADSRTAYILMYQKS